MTTSRPEEGDDALQLTADLSCSAGIRQWYTAGDRCGIAKSLIGGKDETTSAKRGSLSMPSSPIKVNELQNPPSELSTAVTSIINGETTGISYLGVLPDAKEDEDGGSSGDSKKPTEETQEVLDYCPIRHRAGIERLLQIIEGKDPRLDSAPKVWTLAILAKYFNCESSVVSSRIPSHATMC